VGILHSSDSIGPKSYEKVPYEAQVQEANRDYKICRHDLRLRADVIRSKNFCAAARRPAKFATPRGWPDSQIKYS
jgi:hypothetical protein